MPSPKKYTRHYYVDGGVICKQGLPSSPWTTNLMAVTCTKCRYKLKAKLGIQPGVCRTCLENKGRQYSHKMVSKNARARVYYTDRKGKLWYGRQCNDCFKKYVKTHRQEKKKAA